MMILRRDVGSGNWTALSTSGSHPPSPNTKGPPYASTMAVVGGIPTIPTDVPIATVFLTLFLASAAAHMAILQLNKRAGLRFVFSGMLFALCVLRSIALVMRMAWAAHARSVNVAIAANILTQAGSVLVFAVNLALAQRVVRAYHGATLGWHRGTALAFRCLLACVVACLLMAVAVTVQSFFTLDAAARRADRAVQLFAGTFLTVLAFLPIPVVLLAALLPRRRHHHHHHHVEKFGAGRWRTKLRLLLFTAAIATLGAGFRGGTSFDPRPGNHPAWYQSRAAYYCFNFVTDLTVSTAYLLTRFDRRFIVPNGARGPGDYSKGVRVRGSKSPASSSGGSEMDRKKLSHVKGGNQGTGKGKRGGNEMADRTEYDAEKPNNSKRATVLSDRTLLVLNSEAFGPSGEWNGAPWPLPMPWTTTTTTTTTAAAAADSRHSSVPVSVPSSSASDLYYGGDTVTETSSTTCVQEPEAAHLLVRGRDYYHPHPHRRSQQHQQTTPQERHFQPHQLRRSQRHSWGQGACASVEDAENRMSAVTPPAESVVWPFDSCGGNDEKRSARDASSSSRTQSHSQSQSHTHSASERTSESSAKRSQGDGIIITPAAVAGSPAGVVAGGAGVAGQTR
ncbi:hypothetical protein F5Y19DRAFT_301268 [Xylariaceae sp. FL1651]|nr:hypothetical protein F5Y19DRAFT_301268 [Xylariaceae sp. FL1651]